jgi:hypothetical protein
MPLISDYIKDLQEILDKHGDLECCQFDLSERSYGDYMEDWVAPPLDPSGPWVLELFKGKSGELVTREMIEYENFEPGSPDQQELFEFNPPVELKVVIT